MRRELQTYEPDLLVVCDYGQILALGTLAVARLGGINLHASLLPKYRGAAPINWAIYHGETETGVTVIHMTPQVDAGPAIAARPPGHRPGRRRPPSWSRGWRRPERRWCSSASACWIGAKLGRSRRSQPGDAALRG